LLPIRLPATSRAVDELRQIAAFRPKETQP
jgi:hypothetical protein